MIEQLIEANKQLSAKLYTLSDDNKKLATNMVSFRAQVDQLSQEKGKLFSDLAIANTKATDLTESVRKHESDNPSSALRG